MFNNASDTITGSNPVNLTSNGVGVHRFESYNKKRVISDVIVTSSGSGYENKERASGITGINTALNQITILNHGFNSGETVTYSGDASGLSSDQTYIVTVVDADTFKLSSVGVGTTAKENTKQYVDIESVGSENVHLIIQQSPSMCLERLVTTFSGQDFNARLQPVFRGSIESVHLMITV